MQQNSSSKPKLQLIQSFRGLAALLVVLFHASYFSERKLDYIFLSGLFNFGHAGVDFFFVLSGFIIFFIHHSDIGKRDKFLPFIIKRFTRIYPLYWCLTLVLIPIYFLVPSFGLGYEKHFDVILKSLLLFPQDNAPVLAVGWTLCHEIFFYLMFSLTIGLKSRYFKPIISLWLSITLLTFLLIDITHVTASQSLLFNFIFSHYNIHFILGCCAAYLSTDQRIKNPRIVLVLGSALFIFSGLLFNADQLAAPDVIAYGIPSMLILLGSACLELKSPVHAPKLLRVLGNASYSIYLVHFSCITGLIRISQGIHLSRFLNGFILVLLIVFFAILFGYLVYQWVEKPLTNFSKQFFMQKVFCAAD